MCSGAAPLGEPVELLGRCRHVGRVEEHGTNLTPVFVEVVNAEPLVVEVAIADSVPDEREELPTCRDDLGDLPAHADAVRGPRSFEGTITPEQMGGGDR